MSFEHRWQIATKQLSKYLSKFNIQIPTNAANHKKQAGEVRTANNISADDITTSSPHVITDIPGK